MANEQITLGNNTPWPKPGLIHLPSDYSTGTTKKYPLFFFLGGIGEADRVDRLTAYGPSAKVAQGNKMEFDIDGVVERPIIISLAPGVYPPPSYIINVLEEIQSKYRVDPNRITLTGLSAGGKTLNLVASDPEYSKKIAFVYSLQSVSLGGDSKNMSNLARNGGKWWGVEGGSPEENRDGNLIAAAMNAVKSGSAELTIIPKGQIGYTHTGWDVMYDSNFKNKAGQSWEEAALRARQVTGEIPVPVPVPEPTPIPVPIPGEKKLLTTITVVTKVYTDGTSDTTTTKA